MDTRVVWFVMCIVRYLKKHSNQIDITSLKVFSAVWYSWFQSLNPFLKCFTGRWFRLTADALNDGRAKGLSRLVITTRNNYKKEKKSQVARSGEYGGCGKTVTFSDFKKYFTNLGSCVGGLLWSIRTCLNTDTGCRLYYLYSLLELFL